MDVRGKLTNSFRRVFEIDDFVLADEMTAKDVVGWDSLAHINLIMDVEEEFGLRFTVDDIADLKNVGEMIQMLERKLSLA
jgi:acyl carrier protein